MLYIGIYIAFLLFLEYYYSYIYLYKYIYISISIAYLGYNTILFFIELIYNTLFYIIFF
jgi:hypothetical protein